MEIASRAPALSLPGERTAWLFFGACAFAALLLLLPFSRAPYPAMPDYPNHLARAEIIVDAELHGREHPYYAVRHALIPNLALDSFVLGAAKLGLATNDALRLFAAAALLLPIGGVIAIGFALQRTVPWLALLAFPLAYSRYYVWGFLNYFFAIGLAFFGFAAWLSLRRSRTALGALVLALFGIGALLSHLAGFAVLGILVACHELGESRRLTASAMAALAAIGACAGAYVVFFAHDLPLTLAWQDGVLIR
jgi:MFS family permease